MKTATKPMQVHQMTIAQFEKQFPNEDACKRYLMANRWPDGVRCPRCDNEQINDLATMPFKWECSACAQGNSYRFSVLVGTIFENTNKPLRDWFRVMHMMLTSKKGISSLQIYRVMGFGSYNTALLMCNKIRAALGNAEFKQLIGYVEVDETFVGGKAKNKHKGPGGRGDNGGTGGHGKAVVVGAVRRKGNVIARVIQTTSDCQRCATSLASPLSIRTVDPSRLLRGSGRETEADNAGSARRVVWWIGIGAEPSGSLRSRFEWQSLARRTRLRIIAAHQHG